MSADFRNDNDLLASSSEEENLALSVSDLGLGLDPTALLDQRTVHGIYACLTLDELIPTSRTCKSWYEAACTLRPRNATLSGVTDDELFQVVQSPLCRHIGRLEGDEGGPSDLLPQTLLLVKTIMAQVEEMNIQIPIDDDSVHQLPLVLPRGLRTLTLTFQTRLKSPSEWGVDPLLQAQVVRAMHQVVNEGRGLVSCTFVIRTVYNDKVPLPASAIAPLVALANLEHLKLDLEGEAAVLAIRSLKRLRRLDINAVWSVEAFGWLVAGPSAPPALEELARIFEVDEPLAPLVARLPTLTRLDPHVFSLTDPGALLSALPRLTAVKLVCTPAVDVELFVDALRGCVKLTSLDLDHADLTDAHIESLLPVLTQLSSLNLTGRTLTSLACLSSPACAHLSRTLTSLTIYGCHSISPAELVHVRALRSLRTLAFHFSFSEPLDALTLAAFTPGAVGLVGDQCWPELTRFEYTPRETNSAPSVLSPGGQVEQENKETEQE